jgi:hypothetical protein
MIHIALAIGVGLAVALIQLPFTVLRWVDRRARRRNREH